MASCEQIEWSCPRCTLLNSYSITSCNACNYKCAELSSKQYEDASKEAEQKWLSIIDFCKKDKSHFVDDSFPPCNKSLLINPLVCPDSLKNVQWLCPKFILTEDDEAFEWSVYNQPKFNDIKQGILGNCWFLSSLAVLIEHPNLLEKIIITKKYCRQGCYLVRLCPNGEWQTVIIDDLFPCDENKFMLYSKASRKQLFIALIEKAMAKLSGTYESLISGLTVEGLSTLTGYPCEIIGLEGTIDKDIIWAQLLSMKDVGYVFGATCFRQDIEDKDIFKNLGLVSNHAYSILDVRPINKNRLIKLRNPWGSFSWNGDWSKNSPQWTPEINELLDEQSNSDDQDEEDESVFWMSFNDFTKYFSSIDICKVNPNWFDSRMNGEFSLLADSQIHGFKISVFETCEINIGLFYKTLKQRKELSDLDIFFVILKYSHRKKRFSRFCYCSNRLVRKFIGFEQSFKPGDYLILPFSFNYWLAEESSSGIYNLVIHSTKVFCIENEIQTSSLLADVMIQVCVKLGYKYTENLENACVYVLVDNFSGLVAVGENNNDNKYLYVDVNCEESNYLVSTRKTLRTKDTIPPLHRQVLIVLTQQDGKHNQYTYSYDLKYGVSENEFISGWFGNENKNVRNFPLIESEFLSLHSPRKIGN